MQVAYGALRICPQPRLSQTSRFGSRRTPVLQALLVAPRSKNSGSRDGKTVIKCSSWETEEDGGKRKTTRHVASTALALALATLELVAPITPWIVIPPAEALLSAPNANIPRSVDAALRRSIPIVNPASKKIQDIIEDTAFLLRIPQRKPYGNMTVNAEKSIAILRANRASLIEICPQADQAAATELVDTLELQLGKLITAIETRDPDRVSFKIADVLKTLSALELLEAPGLPYLLPPQYQSFPRLTGRATVEFDLIKGSGSKQQFVSKIGGGGSDTGRLLLVLDGYSAPLTAGHFAQLVQEQYYDGAVMANGASSVYAGGPESTTKQTPTTKLALPLELKPADSFEPQYRLPLDISGGEYPGLPMSLFGSVAMTHQEDSFDSDPAKFFFYLFDKANSGLGGLSFDEGTFAVFGYVTDGRELLGQIEKGDVIKSAKIVSGAEKLVPGSIIPDVAS
mmetsp:Transcript_24835/g.41499  ORF Transcript_24835/g.41499 Transcript_24835/m.41499 type:complete len:455 (+) Transcript_24835:121-1485(+)|eukprot:CAMPEP_0198203010 /NCGR_PEP_ID=MMETSP1445-20131203/6241_1 /TAXON_ID=36898 /ORGANISM="Pyramimonas sp., Strain CCMP2087" /LENGTH=454 /DNA_ID=CAMNT_0043874203 /DNA_START=107 /DNA_END=1471 /DNA_ORIENTATION=-